MDAFLISSSISLPVRSHPGCCISLSASSFLRSSLSPSLTHRISHIAYSYIKGLFTSLFTIHPLYLSTSYRDWDNPSSLDSQTRIFNRLLAFFLTLAPLWKTSARV